MGAENLGQGREGRLACAVVGVDTLERWPLQKHVGNVPQFAGAGTGQVQATRKHCNWGFKGPLHVR